MENSFMPKGIKGFQKGHSVPQELRKKWSVIRKGKKSPRKGVILSQQIKDKISFSLKNMPENLKKIRIDKIRKSHLGKKQSPELIRKRVEGRKGYRHSKETKEKIIISQRKRNKNFIYKTDESKIWRQRIEYRLWRESVFSRDNWTCKKCKIKGGKLHPHHIRNFSEEKELRFAIDNGITLCMICHILFHKKYGKKSNTINQIQEFITC